MRVILSAVLLGGALVSANASACAGALDFEKRRLASTTSERLCEAYAGKVVLVVNTASRCGYTPQYEGLEALYRKYAPRGLVVLGFPSNDFGQQEPGTETQVAEFCRVNYGVSFPMFEKLAVSEGRADPLFARLATDAGGQYPRWNFHKYLVGRDGRVVASHGSATTPQQLEAEIEKLL